MLTIATSRYFARQKVIESGLAPVRTTTGAPRFRLGYELDGNVAMLAPYGLRSIEDRAEFEAAYRARLDGFGVEKIRAALEAVSRAAGAEGRKSRLPRSVTSSGRATSGVVQARKARPARVFTNVP
jgi:hypothetical protein